MNKFNPRTKKNSSQANLDGGTPPAFTFTFTFLARQILMEGPLQLLDSGKAPEMFVILFDDMLLITRKKKGLSKKVNIDTFLFQSFHLLFSNFVSFVEN